MFYSRFLITVVGASALLVSCWPFARANLPKELVSQVPAVTRVWLCGELTEVYIRRGHSFDYWTAAEARHSLYAYETLLEAIDNFTMVDVHQDCAKT